MNRSGSVFVIGGGPAGSTVAALLAREGFRVTLAERQTMPRYHIGESLLPSCLKIFDILGIREKIEAHGFQRKDGAFFDWGPQRWEVDFGGPEASLYGFQVVRSEFDQLMLDHAESQGVDVRRHTTVARLLFDGERAVGAEIVNAQGSETVAFDMLVDASGRNGMLATRYLKNRRHHEAFRNVAIWGYWRNANPLSTGPFGAIATCSIPQGWIWAIPMHTGLLSVGVVLHKDKFQDLRANNSPTEIYHALTKENSTIAALLDGARLDSEVRSETDYSYACDRFAGPGWFMAGDAACFLDPLLSTGVHLATFSGMVAAACIASILRGEVSESEATRFFDASYRRAYLRMLVVVSAFYQTHRGRDAYFHEAQLLTRGDYSNVELEQAFRHIISGTEDLRDAASGENQLFEFLTDVYREHFDFVSRRESWADMSLEEINHARTRTSFVNAVQEDFSLTPETAIDHLYVFAEENQLGLRRVKSEAALTV